LSIPLTQQRVAPNGYYGFWTAKTLSEPKIWYEVNRIQGKDLFVAGALITISSLTMLLLAQSWKSEHVIFTLLSVMVLSLTGVTWHGFRVLRRM
jgi:SdpI/YfhL protein family